MSNQTCSICQSDKTYQVSYPSREGIDLSILECSNCGHFAQPLDAYQEIYTTGEFTEQAREMSKTPGIQKIKDLDKRSMNRFYYYRQYLSKMNNFLEVGSSIGSFVHVLKLNGKEAHGLEPDQDYASFSQEQYGIKQDTGLLEDFSGTKTYGSICSFHVLEHVEDPHTFVKKCHDLLEEKGKLLFEFPSLELHMYGSMKETIWKPHIHYFTAASTYQLFSQYFHVSKIGYYGSALFIYAEKSSVSTFDQTVFRRYKRRALWNSRFIKIFPSLPKLTGAITLKQLLLQSTVFQQNRASMFHKLVKFGTFFFKNHLYLRKEKRTLGIRATHVSYYSAWENAGDTVLSKCVRDNFNTLQSTKWHLQKVTDKVTSKSIDQINKGRYVVLGGGGLLLPDSNANNVSGWQWAISDKQLDAITVPLIVYAIGYNFFPGQKPTELFITSVKKLVDKAAFFSLRNRGSIEQLISLIGEGYRDKIHFQPCTTTLIRKFDNIPTKIKSKNIAVNIAFDRYQLRFGKNIYTILDEVAQALKKIESHGYSIYNACHLTNDKKFELVLNKHLVNYKSVDLQYTTPRETYRFYNNMEVVMGSRGHAQMIPFGLNAKIISLGTHNKLKWFLDDIDCTDWFVNLREDVTTIENRIISTFEQLIGSVEADERLVMKQGELLKITNLNLAKINGIINS